MHARFPKGIYDKRSQLMFFTAFPVAYSFLYRFFQYRTFKATRVQNLVQRSLFNIFRCLRLKMTFTLRLALLRLTEPLQSLYRACVVAFLYPVEMSSFS